ncbi:MAG: F0F1 ATP synthase subunit delta [bacterium]
MDMGILKEMAGSLAIILVAQFVVFAVIVIVLRKLLLSDTMSAISRMKTVESELAKKEDVIRQRMDAHEQEFLKKQAAAQEEIDRRRAADEQDLGRLKDRIKAEAKTEADKILGDAQLAKERIREQLVREMAGKAVEYAGDLFKMVVSKNVGEKLNMAFVEELIGALSEVDETSIHVEANESEFIASHKLDPAQKGRLEALLAQKFGVTININEKIDETLLAGLVIKLGSLEIDGSLLNRYKEGVSEIKKQV